MPITIKNTKSVNGHPVTKCPNCQCDVLPNIDDCYRVDGMFKNETARCLSCGYVEFSAGEGNPDDSVHGGCRLGCRMKHRVSLPELRDRADGVKGHFAIGRYIDGFYMHYWSVKKGDYAGYADHDSLSEAEANVLCQSLITKIREEANHVS